ncbi:hypothetical protein [Oleiagrimonas sp. C23AA]|uniref:hypothetical protein n=1 Tax=Oleiagrimonas sp. C23AA TaxID=2719047 RepID=UPI00141ED9E9|nr:hypothetical protein [Oleiagrimonas sp. C23AA]NII10656.1 hypothetical protein [Oleiagrimonas sp. C23AA]
MHTYGLPCAQAEALIERHAWRYRRQRRGWQLAWLLCLPVAPIVIDLLHDALTRGLWLALQLLPLAAMVGLTFVPRLACAEDIWREAASVRGTSDAR